MYICICRAISEKTVRTAHEEGVRKARDVFKREGTRPQCGTCTCHMQAALNKLTNDTKNPA